ncbi:MAG: hypothetical protein H0X41_05715 [Chitinophagaceae bacterium]|nr:hypothetical protein [Chitinophagaceae bacterium]
MNRLRQLPFLFLSLIAMKDATAQRKTIHATETTISRRASVSAMMNSAAQDTSPIRKAIFNKQIHVNPRLVYNYKNFSTTDTVWNLEPYLQSKANCDFEKAIDSNGCILVKYTDGLTKKICGGKLTEVVTPDGKKHVARLAGTTTYMYVMPIPPPPNPSDTDTASRWLTHYNGNLMDEISGLFADDENLINQFKTNEHAKCSNSLYKEIEFRTIFIEEFLKAK